MSTIEPERVAELIEKHKLPLFTKGLKVLNMRWTAQTGDWYIETEEGWFYCRAGDVPPEHRTWSGPSAYGPII